MPEQRLTAAELAELGYQLTDLSSIELPDDADETTEIDILAAWERAVEDWLNQARDKLAGLKWAINATRRREEDARKQSQAFADRARAAARQREALEGFAASLLHAERELAGAATQGTTLYKVSLSDGGWAKLWLQRSRGVVVVNDEVVPEEFKRVEIKIDKRAASKTLQAGIRVPGLQLEEREAVKVRFG